MTSTDRRCPNANLIGAAGSRLALATPALVLDLDVFEHNLAALQALCRESALGFRPHAKTHKSSRIAQLQRAAGATGICTATLREAEAMVAAGIGGVLVTTPIAGAAKLDQLVALLDQDAELMVVIDCAEQLLALERRLKGADRSLQVLVDIDVGMGRTGVASTTAAVALVTQLSHSSCLQYAGLQCYSGMVQHITDLAERRRIYGAELQQLQRLLEQLQQERLVPRIVTGGGTGTLHFDLADGLFTETQAGSFIVMDAQYGDVQLAPIEPPFATALFVQSTVISNNLPGRATTDAGFKSFAMDGPLPRPVRGVPPGCTFQFYGDEFGMIFLRDEQATLPLGSKVECVTPHCDPTVNLHDWYHCVRGDTLVDVWPVDARGSL